MKMQGKLIKSSKLVSTYILGDVCFTDYRLSGWRVKLLTMHPYNINMLSNLFIRILFTGGL